jgi:hypothetical protein
VKIDSHPPAPFPIGIWEGGHFFLEEEPFGSSSRSQQSPKIFSEIEPTEVIKKTFKQKVF